MKELALHMMDMIENSIAAGSTEIEISIKVTNDSSLLVLRVEDNGCGMTPQEKENAVNPGGSFDDGEQDAFEPLRKKPHSLQQLKEAALKTGGGFALESEKGKGTAVTGVFVNRSLSRRPLGDVAKVILRTMLFRKNLEFNIMLSGARGTFFFESANFKEDAVQRGAEKSAALDAERLISQQVKLIFQDSLPEMSRWFWEGGETGKAN